MLFNVKYLAIVAAFMLATTVNAQEPSSPAVPSGTEAPTGPGTGAGTGTGTGADTGTATAPAPTGTGTVPPPCVLECSQTAAAAQGCDLTDTSCICTNAAFQAAAGQCIQTTCTAEEAAAAQVIQQQQCAGVTPSGASSSGVSSSGSAPVSSAVSSVASSSAASTPKPSSAATSSRPASSAPAATSTTPNAAAKVHFGYEGLVALGVGAVGMVVGGGLVL